MKTQSGCKGWSRTNYFLVMSQARYRFSTLRYIKVLVIEGVSTEVSSCRLKVLYNLRLPGGPNRTRTCKPFPCKGNNLPIDIWARILLEACEGNDPSSYGYGAVIK